MHKIILASNSKVRKKILDEKNKVEALSLYWMFLLIIWLVFFLVV